MANGNSCALGENCCKNKKKNLNHREPDEILFNTNEFAPYDPSQEPIFPPELLVSSIVIHHKKIFF